MDAMKASIGEWNRWKERTKNAVVDFGSPVKPCDELAAGEITPSQSDVTGFSIIQAENRESAIDVLKAHPNFKETDGRSMELLEYLHMPGL
jgi:hypothetical protein